MPTSPRRGLDTPLRTPVPRGRQLLPSLQNPHRAAVHLDDTLLLHARELAVERRAVHVQVLHQLLLAEGHDADAVRRGRQAVEVDQQAVAQARLGQQVVLAVEIGELRRDLHEQVRHHAHDVRVAAVVKDALRRKKQHARWREGPDLHPAALRAEGHGLAEARAACSGRAR